MSTHNKHIQDKIRKFTKKNILNYLFSGATCRISYGLKNEFESVMINESSVFESLKIYCMLIQKYSKTSMTPTQMAHLSWLSPTRF